MRQPGLLQGTAKPYSWTKTRYSSKERSSHAYMTDRVGRGQLMIQWTGSPHNWEVDCGGYRRVAATDSSTAAVIDGNWQNRQSSRRRRNIQAPDAYAEYKEEGKEASGRRGQNDSRGCNVVQRTLKVLF